MKIFYGTIIDINFLARGIAVYDSISRLEKKRMFGFYCMDEHSARILDELSLPGAEVIRHKEFETAALKSVRGKRLMSEYCWTSKPAVLRHAQTKWPSIDWAVYLDSDMMVFGDPDQAIPQTDKAKCLLTHHRFSLSEFSAYGPSAGWYNAGYIAFRNDDGGRRVMDWWQARCIECCPATPMNGQSGDQKYLDQFSEEFEGVATSTLKGLNTAPWNIDAYSVNHTDGSVCVDEEELLIYHFQAFQIFGTRLYDCYRGPHRLPKKAVQYIYRPYIQQLRRAYEMVRTVEPGFSRGMQRFLTGPSDVRRQVVSQVRRTSNLLLV